MYTPKHFLETDRETLLGIVREHSFATLITPGDELQITHLPLVLRSDGEALLGHVAKANPHGRLLVSGVPSVAVFLGPHTYVSPAWYQAQPSVPTWNYAAVHVHGRARLIEDAFDSLMEMVSVYDPSLSETSPGSVTEEFVRSRLPAIVAFELPIERIEGKLKLSQNRPREDRLSVIEHLAGNEDGLARMMRERLGQ